VQAAAAAIADPTRREILDALAAGPRTAGEIAARFDASRPAISRHLRLLRESGLVTQEAEGRHRLDALELEVRRTTRDRRAQRQGDVA
jgi:DNA-binding transcriptional ArsR family regulator